MKKIATVLTLLIYYSHSFSQNDEIGKVSLQNIDFLIGKWNVTAERRLSAQGPWDTSKCKAVIKKEVGSAVIEEDNYGTLEGKPFITKTLIAYDKNSKKYQRVFADSEHGSLVDYEGELIGDSLVFDKLFIYPNKSTVKLRVVYKVISNDEFIIENMRMPESTTVWDVTGRMIYKREK
jgi:hypothetical protein